jgi:cytochrome c oxidase subunit IV
MSQDAHHGHDEQAHEPVGYGTYFLTWFSLVVLTAITVTAAGMHFGKASVLVALIIAMIKASVVLFVFMHLKYESKTFQRLLLIVILIMTINIGLTFTDTLFR